MLFKLFLLSFVFITFGFFSTARAATFTVTKSVDVADDNACTSNCSLREAIIAANGNGTGADIINFNLPAGNTVITPLFTLPAIKTSLTINGTTQSGYFGAPIVVLDGVNVGNGNGFNINTPANNQALNVTILGLAINRFGANGIFSTCTAACNLTIQANRIGTSASGVLAMGNQSHGIYLKASPNSTFNIGGTGAFEGNVISGNGIDGIYIEPDVNTIAFIYANYIGTNAAGNTDLGNVEDGIHIGSLNQANEMTVYIGGTNPAARNIISGNNGAGIDLNGQTSFIYGNYIGTNSSGTNDVGNSGDGIAVSGNAEATIGGTINGQNAGNIISGNDGFGILINSTDLPEPVNVKRNRIGTNAAGTAAVPNTNDGIAIVGNPFSAVRHVIGSDTNAADGNLISGNGGDGINLTANISQIKIFGNQIGTNLTQTLKIPNQGSGIAIGGAFNQIGSTASNTANVISGNAQNGIHIFNTSGAGNTVVNNFIGTTALEDNLGNTLNGVLIGFPNIPSQKPSGNFIGEPTQNAGNTIAFNGGDGVNIIFGDDNRVQRNSIHSNGGLGIDLGTNGVTQNDVDDTDTGVNNLQNFPDLSNASPVQLSGTLNSAKNQLFTVDFYRVDSCDASGNGEGRYHIASKGLGVTNNGIGYFNYFDIPLTVGQIVVATATDGDGNTSEFSPCYTVNPPPGVLSFSAATYSANEAAGMRTIVVNRTNGNYGTIQVNYATSDQTAAAGQDYTTTSGTLVFNDGEVVKTFDVPITDDSVDEADETLKLTLSFPTKGSYLVNPATAVLTIVDNDDPGKFQFSSATYSGAENTQILVTVTRADGTAGTVSVDYATSGGTATTSVDYTPISGTLIFGDGETTRTFTVQLLDDNVPEPDENVNLVLSNPTGGAVLGNPATAALNILDAAKDSGFEADVASRPNGNGLIQSNDVVMARSFLTNPNLIDTTSNEFQRADSAPFATKGDGVIASNDVVQARRYITIDAPQTAGGPAAANKQFAFAEADTGSQKMEMNSLNGAARQLQVESTTAVAGGSVTVNIRVDAAGDESEYAFVLGYQAPLSNPVVGSGNAGSLLRVCNAGVAGQVICSVGGFPNNNPASGNAGIGEIGVGSNQILLTVTFAVAADAAEDTPLTLSNVNASNDAAQLVAITSHNGEVTIAEETTSSVPVGGRVLTANGKGIRNVVVSMSDLSGNVKTATTDALGFYKFTDVEIGQTYIFTASAKHLKFQQQSQVLHVNGEMNDINFVGIGSREF